jgi:two-component system, LytTR family, sensor histidine kinase AlgZ
MHPFLRNRAQLLIYLASWLPVVGYFSLLMMSATPAWPAREAIPIALLCCLLLAFLLLSLHALCRGLPLRSTPPTTLAASLASAAVITATIWATSVWLLVGAVDRLIGDGFRQQQLNIVFPDLILFAALVIGIGISLSYLLLSLEQQREAETLQQRMQMLAREAELRTLRAQINPHFLFNSLNSVSALTSVNPERAREMCLLLAEFFRRSLDVGNKELTTLHEELELVSHYLKIEMARFGDRLKVELTVPEELKQFALPPLLLQPLAENAVKHGIAGLVEGGTVTVLATPLADGGIRIGIRNPFDPDQPRRSRKGVGIENVRARLLTAYGRGAKLELKREEGVFHVSVSIAGSATPDGSTNNAAAGMIPQGGTA